MMSALTNLGVVLTAIFVISLAALAAQIAWVIWRRNRFLRQRHNGCVQGGGTEGDYASGGGSFREPGKTTKELLYFFCWKGWQSSSRVEPDRRREVLPTSQGVMDSEDGDNDVLKWHEMYRESRMLYTIKEEEKEGEVGVESDSSGGGGGSVCPKEEEAVIAERITEELSMEVTPFSTPYGSPDRYFTPSPSPTRAEQDVICRDRDDYAKMAALC